MLAPEYVNWIELKCELNSYCVAYDFITYHKSIQAFLIYIIQLFAIKFVLSGGFGIQKCKNNFELESYQKIITVEYR